MLLQYEEHPQNPILTSKNHPEHPIQKSGHASLIETKNGDWYIVFLIGRPLTTQGRCTLGRESAIEEIIWKEDWPVLKTETNLPRVKVPIPQLPEYIFNEEDTRDDFDSDTLSINFQSLRIPTNKSWFSLKERPGYLRLKGKESLTSLHTQALIARRLEHFKVTVSTKVDFKPNTFQQIAGLIIYYNTGHYHYLNISAESNDRVISIISCNNFIIKEQSEKIIIPNNTPIVLKAFIDHSDLQFSFSTDNINFTYLGKILDMSILSDDNVREGSERYRPAFTGSFVGMCCQDLRNNNKHADFDWFEYQEINSNQNID